MMLHIYVGLSDLTPKSNSSDCIVPIMHRHLVIKSYCPVLRFHYNADFLCVITAS